MLSTNLRWFSDVRANAARIRSAKRKGIHMKYFGTDGFRGRANEGLNVEHAFKIGRYVG